MAAANNSKNILKVLTTPSKLASRLDWRKVNGGTVLSLNVHKDRIDLALSSHPSYGEGAYKLESIPLGRKSKVTKSSKNTLANLVKEHKVCGFVVSWPLQPDSQRMGAACGRVLHTLEQLLPTDASGSDGLISPNRPAVLWNDSQAKPVDESDVWGRLAAYAKAPPSNKTIHIASREQYNVDEATVATKVWNDFMRVHWPELYREQEERYQKDLVASQARNTLLTQRAAIAAVAAKQGRSSDEDDVRYMRAAAY